MDIATIVIIMPIGPGAQRICIVWARALLMVSTTSSDVEAIYGKMTKDDSRLESISLRMDNGHTAAVWCQQINNSTSLNGCLDTRKVTLMLRPIMLQPTYTIRCPSIISDRKTSADKCSTSLSPLNYTTDRMKKVMWLLDTTSYPFTALDQLDGCVNVSCLRTHDLVMSAKLTLWNTAHMSDNGEVPGASLLLPAAHRYLAWRHVFLTSATSLPSNDRQRATKTGNSTMTMLLEHVGPWLETGFLVIFKADSGLPYYPEKVAHPPQPLSPPYLPFVGFCSVFVTCTLR